MDVYLASLGCRLNEAELLSWRNQLVGAGHRVAGEPAAARVLVLNSCAVTAEAARKSRKFVQRLHRQNPTAAIVITGCYAELEAERTRALTGVDWVIGNRDKDRLVELLARRYEGPETMSVAATAPGGAHAFSEHGRTRAFVKVQDGCRNHCSYCVVTLARGDERSRPISEIVAEVAALHRSGFLEVVLTGVHLGGYGRDLGVDLHRLVAEVLAGTEIPRVRLSSLEPWDLAPSFWQLWEDTRLMPHLHLPLQSGCDAVLRRMSRRTSSGAYRRIVAAARAAIPDLTVTTDVIIGFPGESDLEWQHTRRLVEELAFAHVHAFRYSPRQGTRAAQLPDPVAPAVQRARAAELQEISEAARRCHQQNFLGQMRSVLWEGSGAGERWQGYTDNYLRVVCPAVGPLSEATRLGNARLEAIEGDAIIATAMPVQAELSPELLPMRSPQAAVDRGGSSRREGRRQRSRSLAVISTPAAGIRDQ